MPKKRGVGRPPKHSTSRRRTTRRNITSKKTTGGENDPESTKVARKIASTKKIDVKRAERIGKPVKMKQKTEESFSADSRPKLVGRTTNRNPFMPELV